MEISLEEYYGSNNPWLTYLHKWWHPARFSSAVTYGPPSMHRTWKRIEIVFGRRRVCARIRRRGVARGGRVKRPLNRSWNGITTRWAHESSNFRESNWYWVISSGWGGFNSRELKYRNGNDNDDDNMYLCTLFCKTVRSDNKQALVYNLALIRKQINQLQLIVLVLFGYDWLICLWITV